MNQFNSKWDFLSFVLCHHLYRFGRIFLSFSFTHSFPFQGPMKEYLEDHLILLDFVGYYLCKLIVHHCLLREDEEICVCMLSMQPEKRKKNGKDSSYDGKIIVFGEKELVVYKNINNFASTKKKLKKNQQQSSDDGLREEKEIKGKYFGLSQFNEKKENSRSLVNV